VTPGAYQTARGAGIDLFVAKLDPALRNLIWSTYVGGDWDTVAQTVTNGFLAGTQSLAMAADGSLVFAAVTEASDFPVSPDTSPPPYPGNVTPVLGVLDPSGSHLVFSCALPVTGNFTSLTSLATGDGRSFFAAGTATISEIAAGATLNAEGLDGFLSPGGGYYYPFLVRVDLSSRSVTYLGPLREINGLDTLVVPATVVAADGSLIVASLAMDSYSGAFPAASSLGGGSPGGGYGTVLFDLDFSSEKQPLIAALVNPASLLTSGLSPGQVVEVRGTGLGPGGAPVQADDPGNPPLLLGGAQLIIDGAPVPLISVGESSIVAVAPASLPVSGTSSVAVVYGGSQSDARSVPRSAVNPAIFTVAGTGSGQAIASNPDGSANSSASPVGKGAVIRLIVAGLGSASDTVTATVSGLPAQVKAVAPAGSYPPGYLAVDVAVPAGAPESDFAPVAIAIGGVASQSGVTISIR
jgi:uncharacterized protein (TIGR03437 family)